MKRTLIAMLAASSSATILAVTPAIAQDAPSANGLSAAPLLATTLTVAAQVVPQTPAAPGQKANDPAGLEDNDAEDEEEDEIVITGTLIRGTAPTGTNPITVGEEQIEAIGASRSSDVLASLPQITGNFFNGIPQTEAINANAARGFNQTTNRPSLRPNPFAGTDSGNSTLLLFDGARQAGIGVNGSSSNPDSIPPALLQRVEVNPDGGSATYGSDAIGGVINFITRKRYEGLQVGGAVGFVDDQMTWEANALAGTDWGSGGAYIGYAFSKNDWVLNRERDFFQPLDFATGLERGLNCDPANIRRPLAAPFRYYAAGPTGAPVGPFTVLAGSVSGTANVCSLDGDATLASANEQHSVMARISQDITDDVEVGLRLRFSDQRQAGLTAPAIFTARVTNANPFFRPITSGPDAGATSYDVLGNFGDAFDESERLFTNSSRSWGALADITWNIGKWRFYGFANYDRSKSDFSNPAFNAAVQTAGFQNAGGTTTCSTAPSTANCFNPFDIGASNPTLLANLSNFFNIGEGRDEIINFRGVFDGPLFDLPAGPLRAAVGVEYFHDKFSKGLYFGTTPSDLVMLSLVQTNKSVFGEVSIPVFSEEMDIPLFHDLRLSAAGRYDKYSGLDGVFNPKLGASWMPFKFITFRGNWSKTFRAPTTVDLLGTSVANTTVSAFPACVFGCFAIDPTKPVPGPADVFIAIQGTNPNVTPQKGENWSYGADFAYKQFQASITYFRINYLDLLANPFNGTPVFPNLAFLTTLCPGGPGAYTCTQAQVDAHVAQAGIGNVSAVPLNNIYGLYDTRTTNLGNSRVGGWDYSFQFTQPFDWGSLYLGISGSVTTLNETQALPGQPFVSNIQKGGNNTGSFFFGRSLHRWTLRTGINSGGFRAQATLNHTAGYDTVRTATLLQDHVNAFDVINLFLSYEFQSQSGLLKDLEITLNVNNLLDTDPPKEFRTNSGNGYINGSTLGRMIKIGLRKKFGGS